jgi:phage FluMu protein Com
MKHKLITALEIKGEDRMALRAMNYDAIVERGGSRDNTEYHIVKCAKCNRYALYEAEVSFIYFNPERLSEGILYGLNVSEEVKCPACGAVDSFNEAGESDYKQVQASDWGFAL